jgi:hypothetical protein
MLGAVEPQGTTGAVDTGARELAAGLAGRWVADVRDDPDGRLALLARAYAPVDGAPAVHLRYRRAALAFMGWQVRRGVLGPLDAGRPGSAWWRAVNERLLRDTCEARLRLLGHPGPASSASVAPSVDFARRPSVLTWYRAHNVTIVSAYLEHRELAEAENRAERFFLNLVLARVLFAHALVAAPRLALGWLAPAAGWLGDPRRQMTGRFLAVSRVLPDRYPLTDALETYVAGEHAVGRLLDVGVIVPRLGELYRWSAEQLAIPALADLVRGAVPTYAWDPADGAHWTPAPSAVVRVVRRVVPPAVRPA